MKKLYNPNSHKLLGFLERIKMSKILDQMKQDLIVATKAKNTVEKDILRLIISDSAALESSKKQGGVPLKETQVIDIINQIIIANQTTLSYKPNESLDLENAILKKYVPFTLSYDEIQAKLNPLIEQIKNEISEGMAMKLSMNYFKSEGLELNVDGKDVKAIVQKIRG